MFPCKECENVSSIPLISPYLLDYNRSQIAVRAPHWPEGAGLTDLLPGNSADPWDRTRASVMEQTLWQRLISNLDRIGADKTDSQDVRLQKRLLVAIALMISPACLLWGSIILAFGEPTPATIPLTYTGMSVAGGAERP